MVHKAKPKSSTVLLVSIMALQSQLLMAEQAVSIDKRDGNTQFQDGIALEFQQMRRDYQTFIDAGHHTKTKPPYGYMTIRVHLVF